jgi:SAM-dependent methyltransferase
VKARLAEWLVCPVTREPLSLRVDRQLDGEVLEGELSSASGRRYPVTGGVPRMLPAEGVDAGQAETAQAFSAKWQRAPEFGHEEKSRTFYVDWYLERYHFADREALRDALRGATRILDAGTGNGRDTRLYAEHSSAEVVGVDISVAIDSAYRHLGAYPNVHLVQADLTQLPFPVASFDFVACDQVLHHTRDTEQSFKALATHVRPGGTLAIYVYRKKAALREMADDYLREVTARMSDDDAWQLAEQLTELGRALCEPAAQVTVPAIPALGISAGTYDVQRFIYWNLLKCYWNPTLSYGDSVITNFDWYRPRYAHRHTGEEVRGWFAAANFDVVTFDECDSGISIRGRRRS